MAAYQLAADTPPAEVETAPVVTEIPNNMAAYQLAADTPPVVEPVAEEPVFAPMTEAPTFEAEPASTMEMPVFQSVTEPVVEAPVEEPAFTPMTEAPTFDSYSAPATESVNFESAATADFSFGITGDTGVEETPEEPSAASLFSADASFGTAGAGTGEGDGFGIGETPAQSSESNDTPFTFFDAN